MQQRFLLQILLLAQHVSGTTMPIIRSSRELYSGCCLRYLVLTRPTTWKPQVCTSLLQMYAPVHHFRIPTITHHKRDTWPTDRNIQALPCKKPTKDTHKHTHTHTHTRPPRHSTHLITNLDNTRHLILRTQILPNWQITFYIFTARNTTGSNHCIILLSSWWWA